jgi:hypothetical protein
MSRLKPTPGDVFREIAAWYDEHPDHAMPTAIDINHHSHAAAEDAYYDVLSDLPDALKHRSGDSLWSTLKIGDEPKVEITSFAARKACTHPDCDGRH